MTVKYKQ